MVLSYKKSLEKNTDEIGLFFGYASIFNLEDSCKDIIINKAFKDTITKNKTIPLLWQHDRNKIIGNIYNLREDYIGLYIEGKVNYVKYYKIYSLIKNNLLNGLSIGYIANKFTFNPKGRRIIKSLDLIEVSLVLSPANKLSNVIYCK